MTDAQSLNMQANLSTDTQSLNMQANLSTETILEASLSVGAISSGGLTTEQMAQLDAAYQHSQTDNVTDITEIENTISTYVTAHKEELKGDKGDKGDTGAKGDAGAKGEKGDTGAKGDKGDKGDTGATGANGITPTLKIGSTSTGNAGTNASVTMTDNNNVYTLNFVIPKGEKGDTGAKGDAGAKGQDGVKGADGITPTLKVGSVTTLAAGSNATVTMSKNNNEYTLNFGIPKGNKGDTGASGSSGETTVVNPTITIGTVTNGDTASATITGDSPNYTLNLVLPKGAKGDAGEKGADGITPTIAVGNTTTGEAGTNAGVTMSKSGTTYTFNFTIPKGDKGDAGADGAKGEKGDPFTYADFTSEQLAALKGDKGDKGDTGADGAKGDKGDRGEKGADGVTPTFTIGTVSTGAEGSTATVTVTGTAPNYVLNFTIPKGDKGDAGEAGTGGDVDLSGYAKLTGATFTGKVTSPIVSATRYFETPILVGEGDDSTYYHRVVFGHKNFDKMEFHEYGGSFSFFKNQKGGANDGQLLFRISPNEVDSKLPLKENGVRVYSPNNKPTAADLGITTGTNGATFTPAVDSAGNLSWSNDKGLANPNTVNIKGDKGDAGAKGDKGDPFTYADFTPEQLTALKGAKGDKGDKGDTGAKGDKGEKGDTGAKGADGQTPNISIGTITTGAAGTNASASISGTTPNLTLNLTIPKGDKGDKGAQGESINKTVSVKSSSSTVKLTDESYQYLEGSTNITITLPSISTSTDITEIHLFYTCSRAYTLTFPSSIKWQGTLPTIEAGKYYEFILTRLHNGVWLAGVVVYG